MNIEDRINPWLKTPFDEEIHSKVKAMQQYPKELEDAFYKDLDFGTGGMRGIMGAVSYTHLTLPTSDLV